MYNFVIRAQARGVAMGSGPGSRLTCTIKTIAHPKVPCCYLKMPDNLKCFNTLAIS